METNIFYQEDSNILSKYKEAVYSRSLCVTFRSIVLEWDQKGLYTYR